MKVDTTPSLELLADYVEGLVDKNTALRIEKHLSDNESDKLVTEGIRHYLASHPGDRAGLEDYLSAPLPPSLNQTPPSPRGSVIPIWLKVTAVAAALLAAVWLFFPEQKTYDELLAQYTTSQVELPFVVRSDEADIANRVFSLYDSRNYSEVQSALKGVDLANLSAEVRLVHAISTFHLGEFERSLGELEPLIAEQSRLSPYVLWYAALAELNLNHRGEALVHLVKLHENRQFRTAEAQDLLVRLTEDEVKNKQGH
jgi:hypothetical protein